VVLNRQINDNDIHEADLTHGHKEDIDGDLDLTYRHEPVASSQMERSTNNNMTVTENRVTPLQLLQQPIGAERSVTFASDLSNLPTPKQSGHSFVNGGMNADLARACAELRDNSPKPNV